MKHYGLLMCTFILALMVAQAYAQEDFLNPSDKSANSAIAEDIKHTMGGVDIFNTSSNAGSAGSANGAVIISAKNTKLPQSTSSPSNVAGSISLVLADSTIRSVTIILTQSEDIVFGKGSMISGGVTQDIAATGSISGGNLNIDLLSLNDINLYKLSLDINGKSLSGGYKAFGAGSATWAGTATGSVM